jgi:hypothetical protein
LLWLGPRRGGEPYGHGEFDALQQAARPVAQAMRVALHVHPEPEAGAAEQAVEAPEGSAERTRADRAPAAV